jgi:hypothetical protein
VRLAHRHKATLEALFSEGLNSRGAGNADRLAREVWMLLEGTMIMTLLHGDSSYVRAARDAALKLVVLSDKTNGA